MKISNELTDLAILVELGQRITRRRLEFQLTQARLAKEAGIAKRTLERVEAGETAQTSTLIRIFRVLDLLGHFNNALPETQIRPIELMQQQGKVRQRATGRRGKGNKGKPGQVEQPAKSKVTSTKAVAKKTWAWGDDS